MDIERLKKLNSLAGELKHQGIAQNYEDAAFLAVTMVGEQEEQCLSDMHINDDQSLVIKEIIKGKPVKPHEEGVKESADVKQSMTKEEVREILQNFVTQMESAFVTLQAKIEQSNSQIAQLMEKVNALQTSIQQKTQIQEQIPVQRTLKVQPPAVESPAAHPRTGNFVTDDVSIEKMFYYGKKS